MGFSNLVVLILFQKTISVEKWGEVRGSHKAIAMAWRKRAQKVKMVSVLFGKISLWKGKIQELHIINWPRKLQSFESKRRP